jgi:hypothetical protein
MCSVVSAAIALAARRRTSIGTFSNGTLMMTPSSGGPAAAPDQEEVRGGVLIRGGFSGRGDGARDALERMTGIEPA